MFISLIGLLVIAAISCWLFLTPFVAMVLWGALVSELELNLTAYGYWVFFIGNLALSIVLAPLKLTINKS